MSSYIITSYSYNYDNNVNLGTTTKINDIAGLFRDKSDLGNQDIDLIQLAPFWREAPDKEKRALLDQFRTYIAKEWGESDAGSQQAGSVKSRVV